VVVAAVGSYAASEGAWRLLRATRTFDPQPPHFLVGWVATGEFGFAATSLTWQVGSRVDRLLRAGCAVVAAVLAAASINAYYGYYPTVSALLGHQARNQISQAELGQRVRATATASTATPSTSVGQLGVSVPITIPPTRSGFHARGAWIYLPPAWFHSPRPTLPAIMVLHGTPGSPADMLRAGEVDAVSDHFEELNGGRSPILVMPDINGSFGADTECVDTPKVHAETYLVDDVRNYVINRFGADPTPDGWGVVGYSEGGTCAVELALRHSDRFHTFVDAGGPPRVMLRSPTATFRTLFGGSRSVARSYDVAWLLRHHRYDGMAGWITMPTIAAQLRWTLHIAHLARRSGIDLYVSTTHLGHTYPMFHQVFTDALPWLCAHLSSPVLRAPAQPVGTRAGPP
jgi:S-formylglutathione hydrolase FrmB